MRVAQTVDESENLGHAQHLPRASHSQFEDDQSCCHPIRNAPETRNRCGIGGVSHTSIFRCECHGSVAVSYIDQENSEGPITYNIGGPERPRCNVG